MFIPISWNIQRNYMPIYESTCVCVFTYLYTYNISSSNYVEAGRVTKIYTIRTGHPQRMKNTLAHNECQA